MGNFPKDSVALNSVGIFPSTLISFSNSFVFPVLNQTNIGLTQIL